MFVLHFLPLNVDNLIHACPEACFPSFAKCPVSELPYSSEDKKEKACQMATDADRGPPGADRSPSIRHGRDGNTFHCDCDQPFPETVNQTIEQVTFTKHLWRSSSGGCVRCSHVSRTGGTTLFNCVCSQFTAPRMCIHPVRVTWREADNRTRRDGGSLICNRC